MWKPRLRRSKRRRFFIAVSIIGFMVYTVAWLFIQQSIERNIKNLLANAAQSNIQITSGQYSVDGYPLKPTISFNGEININGAMVFIPNLKIKGFFIPSTITKISLPQGLAYDDGIFRPPLTTIDSFSASVLTPKFFPDFSSSFTVNEWRKSVGAITVQSFSLAKGDFHVQGDGLIGVDEYLQPHGKLETTSTGYEAFIQNLQSARVISQQEAVIAKAALHGLSEEQPITKKRIINLDLRIENSQAFLGPIPVARLPLFDWDRRN